MEGTTNNDDRPRRTVRRALTLPSGRAVLGALLVAVAVVGLFTAAGRGDARPATGVVVAARPIDPGRVITAEDVRTTRLTLPDALAAQTLTDPTAVVGATALAPLAPGDLVQRSSVRLGQPTDGALEVSVRLPVSRALDGRLQRGEAVDLVATLGPTNDACTSVIVTRAVVVAASGGGDELLAASDEVTLTLGLASMDEVLATVHAADQGELTVVRAAVFTTGPEGGDDADTSGGSPVCTGDPGEV